MRTKIIIALAVVAALPLMLTACDKTLKTNSIEPQIKTTLTRQGAKVASVDCPGDVTAKKGDQFDCDVTLQKGKPFKVQVTQTDAKGHVVFVPKAPAGAK